MTRKKIVILGSTGSIGKNTLDVLRGMQETYEVYGLAAHKSVRELLAQAAEFRPARLALTDAAAAREAAEGFAGELLAGPQALCDICEGADLVVLSVVGMAGLPQGNTRPVLVTGRPISSELTRPPNRFCSCTPSRYSITEGDSPVV